MFNKEGEIDFYDTTKTGYPGISSFDKSFIDNIFDSKLKKIKVKATTLDKYCSFHSSPTFIKIDVEGAESHVLEGGIKTLKKTNPVIAMEVFNNNKLHLKAIEILYNLGYKSYEIDKNGELVFMEKLCPEKEISEEDKFNNFIFKR
ncbi:FkbM family methyltransferase [Patescibacteria group bacterium]|nr:FkbM family methyltransferase [Patescibacteria group bacterium]